MSLIRKILILTQLLLGAIVLYMGLGFYFSWKELKSIAHFLALTSLLTGLIIYTSCTSPDIKFMQNRLRFFGICGLLASIGSAMVFWKIIPLEAWYYFNLFIVMGVCGSIYAETEKLYKPRTVIQAVAGIITLISTAAMLFHILGWLDLKLPLFILTGATVVLVMVVLVGNYRKRKINP